MKATSLVACGVLIAACSSNKPANQPTRNAPEAWSRSSDTPSVTAPSSESDEWREEAEEVGQTATTEPTDAAEVTTSAEERGTGSGVERSGALSTVPETAPPPAGGTTTEPAAAPDDTKKNERDRDPGRMTPPDQSNQKSDLKITQEIRKAVMGDSTLSFTAKNVKIITSGGKVTLRGPVKTEAEHAAVVAAARRIAGDANVIDQIEVKEK